MQQLATALAKAIVHIAYRTASSDEEEDEDVHTLEELTALLQLASASELEQFKAASKRLAADSKNQTEQMQYEQLMEQLGLEEYRRPSAE